MSEKNLQQKPVNKPHRFSFRKATKGIINMLSFILEVLPVVEKYKSCLICRKTCCRIR